MTSTEFTIWLKGFMTACNEYSPTPKQWDIIKEELDKVSDNIGTPIGPGWGIPNTAPIMPLPHYPNPLDNPYKITCSSGSFGTTSTPGFAITTTPGVSSITYATPQFVTSTAKFPISGSNVSYTIGGNNIKD